MLCNFQVALKISYKRKENIILHTWVIRFGSIKSGNLKTANNEREVNAFAGVKSPPRREYTPNETTVTTTGILFRIKLFSCNKEAIDKNKREDIRVYFEGRNMVHNKTSHKSTYVQKCQFSNLCKDIRNIPQQATEPCGTKKVHHRGCPAPLTGSFAPKHNT